MEILRKAFLVYIRTVHRNRGKREDANLKSLQTSLYNLHVSCLQFVEPSARFIILHTHTPLAFELQLTPGYPITVNHLLFNRY